jgi:chemotaxis protein CheD
MHRIEGLIDIFLQPGEFFVADAEYQMRTMLGSCVSITLWHPFKRVGAMSHFLLPTRGATDRSPGLDARYGDEALELMLAELRQMGVAPSQCQGKVFGGGNMFPDHFRSGVMNVGQRNGEAARSCCNHHGVQSCPRACLASGTGRLFLTSANGDVWSRQVPLSHLECRNGTKETCYDAHQGAGGG